MGSKGLQPGHLRLSVSDSWQHKILKLNCGSYTHSCSIYFGSGHQTKICLNCISGIDIIIIILRIRHKNSAITQMKMLQNYSKGNTMNTDASGTCSSCQQDITTLLELHLPAVATERHRGELSSLEHDRTPLSG